MLIGTELYYLFNGIALMFTVTTCALWWREQILKERSYAEESDDYDEGY